LTPLLPAGTARVLVAGSTGSGKTTMARELAGILGVPHTEMDALVHGPGWTPRPQFLADVEAMLATGRWITEYQYRVVKERLLAAAQAVVWLDHPFPLVARRLIGRSIARAINRQPFYNGNTERASAWLHASHPLRIVFSRHFAAKRARTEAELAEAAARGVVVVRLRGAQAERRWLAAQRRAVREAT
jgi:adenylate kinase family enzyme